MFPWLGKVPRLDTHVLVTHLHGSVDVAVVSILLAFVCVYPGKHEKDSFFQTLDIYRSEEKFILYCENNDSENYQDADLHTSYYQKLCLVYAKSAY